MKGCARCGGTGQLFGNQGPCPDCAGEELREVPIVYGIPAQYQGVKFDRSFLPEKEQAVYGVFMEDLLHNIINNYGIYQKNMIICSRPNSGKTVWAYTIISTLMSKGYDIPTLRDIVEVRDIMNSYDDRKLAVQYSTARCAIIKLPRDLQPWMFDTISSIIERRVRSNGFTIFLFGGTLEDLKFIDRYDKLRYIRGNGSYNTVQIESF